jgi:two-component system LytT family sensor kinase
MGKGIPRSFFYHTIAWLAFSAYLLVSTFPFYIKQYTAGFIFFKQLLYVVVFLVPFYINYCWLIPRCFIRKRRPWLFSIGLVLLLGVDFLLNLGHGILLDIYWPGGVFFEERLANFGYIFTPLLLLGVSSGLRLGVEYYREQNEKQELRKQILNAEMALLKSQINPHFLFNSLNNIYALAQKKSPLTADAILKLSEIMRYVLHDATAQLVTLKQEVEFIQNFIALQRLRLQKGIEVVEQIVLPEEELMLPPLLLIPFVENAFKHSDLVHQQRPIEIQLKVEHRTLYFDVKNKLGNIIKERSSGIGLMNLRMRLDRLMPDKFNIKVQEEEGSFCAHLSLHFG